MKDHEVKAGKKETHQDAVERARLVWQHVVHDCGRLGFSTQRPQQHKVGNGEKGGGNIQADPIGGFVSPPRVPPRKRVVPRQFAAEARR